MEENNRVQLYQQRPFGLLEKYQLSKHLTHAYGNITLTAYLEHHSLSVNQRDTTSERYKELYLNYLQASLVQLIDNHPMLSLIVQGKDLNTVHFAQLSQIDLTNILDVDLQHENLHDCLTQVIQEETDKEFDIDNMQLPLWRLRIVVGPDTTTTSQECLLVLTMHHLIGDGMSLTIFMKELLASLSNTESLDDNNTSKIVNVRKVEEVPPPYELAGAPSLSILWDIVPVLFQNFVPKVLPSNIARFFNPLTYDGWKGDYPAVEDEPHRTAIQPIHVPAGLWQPIMQEARKRGISAHAVLYTCFLKTWSTLYDGDEGSSITEVCTPINCRSLCKPPLPGNQIGNFVGSYTSIWRKEADGSEDIWKRAKRYYQDLRKNMLSAAKQTLFLKFLPDFPVSYCEFWYDKRKNSSFGRTGGLEISDLGKLMLLSGHDREKESSSAVEKKKPNIKHVYFCQSAQVFTNVITMNSISLNDQLYCTLSYQKGSVKQDIMNRFDAVFIDILKSLKL